MSGFCPDLPIGFIVTIGNCCVIAALANQVIAVVITVPHEIETGGYFSEPVAIVIDETKKGLPLTLID